MGKVNKVTGSSDSGEPETTTESKKKKEKGRIDFPIKEAQYRNDKGEVVTAVNEDTLLIAVPIPIKDEAGKVLYAGFNPRKHLPLKKGDFAGLAEYLRYQAFIARYKASQLVKLGDEKLTKAKHIEKFGDEETRKKVAKYAKLKEQLEKLQKTLEAEEVDISDV